MIIVKEKIAENKQSSLFYSGEIAYIEMEDGVTLHLMAVGEKILNFEEPESLEQIYMRGQKVEKYMDDNDWTDKDVEKHISEDHFTNNNWFEVQVTHKDVKNADGIMYQEVYGNDWNDIFALDAIAYSYDEGIELLKELAEDYKVQKEEKPNGV